MEKCKDKTIIIKENKISEIAKQVLKEVGIKIHYLGFKYWITAIVTSIENEQSDREDLRMMELYYLVARSHKTTANKVERAMRYAYSEIDLKSYFNVNYSINNTALLFLLKEEVVNKIHITHTM